MTPIAPTVIVATLPSDANTDWLGLVWLLVAMVPPAIGGILQPSINSLITRRIDPDERGGILGISSAFLSGANALAPLIAGALFATFSFRAPFWLWAALMGVLLIVAIRRIAPDRPASATAPVPS